MWKFSYLLVILFGFINLFYSFIKVSQDYLLIGMTSLLIACVGLINKNKNIFLPLHFTLFSYFICFVFTPFNMLTLWNYKSILFFSKALFYTYIGLVCFILGYFSSVGKILACKSKPIASVWDKQKIKIFIITCIIISILSYLLLVRLTNFENPISPFFNIRYFKNSTKSHGLPYLVMLMVFSIKISVGVWFIILLEKKKKTFSEIVLFLSYLILGFMLLFPLGIRGINIGLIIELMVLYHFLYKEISLRYLFIIFLFIMIYAVVTFYLRGISNPAEFYLVKNNLSIHTTYKTFFERFAAIKVFADLLEFFPSDQLGYQYGRTIVSIFLRVIPRSLWPDKPYEIGALITKVLYPEWNPGTGEGSATEPSIFGELYINFDIAGIIIGLSIFGILIRWLNEYIKKYVKNKGVILYYSLIFTNPLGFLLAGINSAAMMNFLFASFICLLTIKFIKKRV